MPSLIPGYEYDIFISYRQKDNKYDGWVTEFIGNLRKELEATFKEDISIYFDENPHDGLLETHQVDKSLEGKLKCLVLITVLSRTYCDPASFAWQNEFLAFRNLARTDPFGLDINLANRNVAGRILPVQIHGINPGDRDLFEKEIGGALRSITFIFNSQGVNRPLTPKDSRNENANHTLYRDQINKTANAIEEIISALRNDNKPTSEKQLRPPTTPQPKNQGIKRVWSELTRRNVFRAGFVYVIAALAARQLASILAGSFELSDQVPNVVTWLLAGIFPIAMLLAWLYEVSPQGLIRTTSPQSADNPYKPAQKKPLTGNVVITLLTGILIFLFVYHWPNPGTVNPRKNEKSIAVLPFINLSGDKEQEYYSDGMMEVIINQLVKIRQLTVTPLHSSMIYKDSKKPLRNIASELGVAHILEGRVQRSGDKVRIAVQLSDGRTEKTLWSDIFVTDESDIFAIQEDISKNIARELKAVLSIKDVQNLSLVPTTSKEAYDFYLKSLYYERKDDWIKGIEMCNKAIDLDPKFTLAYVLRSNWNGTHFFNKWPTWEGRDKLAKADMIKAIELNPDLPEVKICQAFTLYYTERKYEDAIRILSELQKDRPNDVQVYFWLGTIQRRQGLWREALRNMEFAVNADPNNTDILIRTAYLHYVLHHYSKAIEYAKKALSLDPEVGTAGLVVYYSLLTWKGDVTSANNSIVYNSGVAGLESISDNMRLEWARSYYNRQFGELLLFNDKSKSEIVEDQNLYEPKSLRYARIYYLSGNRAACKKYAAAAITFLKERLKQTKEDYRIYSALGYAYAYEGNFNEAIASGVNANKKMPIKLDAFSDGLASEQSLLEIYIIAGKYELAFDRIEYLLTIPGYLSVQLLKIDPVYDQLRTLPRYSKIIHTDYKLNY